MQFNCIFYSCKNEINIKYQMYHACPIACNISVQRGHTAGDEKDVEALIHLMPITLINP